MSSLERSRVRRDPGMAGWFELGGRAVDPAVHARYPDAEVFLEAVERFWGSRAFVTAPGRPSTRCAACPNCESKRRPADDPRRFPLVVEQHSSSRWTLTPWCGCSPVAIVKAIIRSERNRLDAELTALEDAA